MVLASRDGLLLRVMPTRLDDCAVIVAVGASCPTSRKGLS